MVLKIFKNGRKFSKINKNATKIFKNGTENFRKWYVFQK